MEIQIFGRQIFWHLRTLLGYRRYVLHGLGDRSTIDPLQGLYIPISDGADPADIAARLAERLHAKGITDIYVLESETPGAESTVVASEELGLALRVMRQYSVHDDRDILHVDMLVS